MMNALALYLATVLATIVPSSVPEARRMSIANDIAAVTLSEERAFPNDESGKQTALLLTSLAHLETGRSWAEWIDDGRCNDDAWRARHPAILKTGDCDGGKAYSMWQVHVPGDSRELGMALIADRRAAIRAALAIARTSLQSGRGLCDYTGEKSVCRLARGRLMTARYWADKFPYHPEAVTGAE